MNKRIVCLTRRSARVAEAPVAPGAPVVASHGVAAVHKLASHLEAFKLHLRAEDYARTSIASYFGDARAFLRWLIAENRPLDQEALFHFRDHMMLSGSRPRTIRLHFLGIARYFLFLAEAGLAAQLPDPRKVRMPKPDAACRHMPTDQEVSALKNAVNRLPARTLVQRGERARQGAVLAILLHTGVRRGELLGLDLTDIQQGEGDEGRILRVRKAKGGEYRRIPINAECGEYLDEWLSVREELVLERAERGSPFTGDALVALFPFRAGQRMNEAGVASLWESLTCMAGLAGVRLTPHCLRAFFVTRTAAVMDIPTASRLAGHASIKTTADFYLKTDMSRMRAAVDALSLDGPTGPGRNRPDSDPGGGAAGAVPALPTGPQSPPPPSARANYFRERRLSRTAS